MACAALLRLAYPLLTIAGLAVLRRSAPRDASRALGANALAFVMLEVARAFGGTIFRDLKEIEFVSPLVAVATAASLRALAARGRLARFAAVALAIGLAGFGLFKYRAYLAATTGLEGL